MVATANAKLRDATVQLRDVLLHRLRSEARIGDMEKRLVVVKENRQKHAEGGMSPLDIHVITVAFVRHSPTTVLDSQWLTA